MYSTCVTDDAVSADIRLETEGDDSSDDCPTGLSPSAYHPRRAMRIALMEWLAEFNRPISAFGSIQQPQIPTPVPILPSVNTCMSVTSTTQASPGLPQANINQLAEVAQDITYNPAMNPVMNSLVSENKVVVDAVPEEADTASTVSQDASTTSGVEPMDCNPSPANSPPHNEDMLMENSERNKVSDSESEESTTPIIDTFSPEIEPKTSTKPPLTLPLETPLDNEEDNLTVDDLQLLVDLFYLPFEHGRQGVNILNEFNWLKMNSHLVIDSKKSEEEAEKPEVREDLALYIK